MSSADFYRAEVRRFLQRTAEVSDPDLRLARYGDGIRRAGQGFGRRQRPVGRRVARRSALPATALGKRRMREQAQRLRWRRRQQEFAARELRRCEVCDGPLPLTARFRAGPAATAAARS